MEYYGGITFDITSNGKGGFDESTLTLDPGANLGIYSTDITFDFLGGASPLDFFNSGAFNLNNFFLVEDGSQFSSDFDLANDMQNDMFSINTPGYEVTGFDPGNGALQLGQGVPETASSFLLVVLGLGALAAYRRIAPRLLA
jgi:hypothetical protein